MIYYIIITCYQLQTIDIIFVFQTEFDEILGIPSEFFSRMAYVSQCSKFIDEENKTLLCENEVLKKKITENLSSFKRKIN